MENTGQPIISYNGPYFYVAGTLAVADKDDLFMKTGCDVNIRDRKQWNFQRGLTTASPPSRVVEALRLADQKIKASVKNRPPPGARN